MNIGIPRESRAGETRVAATPETVKKLAASGKHALVVEAGAGAHSSIPDTEFQAAGARISGPEEAFGADIVLKVRGPTAEELPRLKRGAILIGLLNPFDAAAVQSYAGAGVSGYALEWLPRITRAQSMDVLSSQANIAGYKAVIIAAGTYGRFMPMLMTAAGTVKAARVLILGVGVAGLQAIATAKRLGARHRGQGNRQPDRADLVRRDDARAPGSCRCGRRGDARYRASARRWSPHTRFRRQGDDGRSG